RRMHIVIYAVFGLFLGILLQLITLWLLGRTVSRQTNEGDVTCQGSAIAFNSTPVGDRLTLNLERKLMPSRPSIPLPNGLLSSRTTAVMTSNASAFPTLIELACPISANALPPTVFIIT